MKIKNVKLLIISLLISLSAGAIGSIFSIRAIPIWYMALQKPSFNPPNWIFGPVWTILYILIGIYLYLIWSKGLEKKRIKDIFIFFFIQLFLNTLWSIVFFGFHNLFISLIIIYLLLASVGILIYEAWKIDKNASLLLIPYFVWIAFASVLNLFVWLLN